MKYLQMMDMYVVHIYGFPSKKLLGTDRVEDPAVHIKLFQKLL
jgi:hypothetical protein